ncbi:MAG: MarR family winged helix-turn-helix transcriptional regulator [Pseudoxanthomonas sp.]
MDRPALLFQLTSALPPAMRAWQRLIDTQLSADAISGACVGPLLMIGRAGGGIRQVAVAQQLGMEGPSLVRLLDKLCAGGLVRRENDSSDRRANQLWLSDEGQALYLRLEEALKQLRARVFAGLSSQELQAVLRFYQALEEASTRLP